MVTGLTIKVKPISGEVENICFLVGRRSTTAPQRQLQAKHFEAGKYGNVRKDGGPRS